jgi:hypothetical protein
VQDLNSKLDKLRAESDKMLKVFMQNKQWLPLSTKNFENLVKHSLKAEDFLLQVDVGPLSDLL